MIRARTSRQALTTLRTFARRYPIESVNRTEHGSRWQRTTWDSDISKMRASSRRRAVWIPIPGKTCVRSCRFWHKSDGYTQAKRGYARGWEPVQFVDRVQRFLTLLEWQPGQGPTTAAMPAAQAPAPTNTSH